MSESTELYQIWHNTSWALICVSFCYHQLLYFHAKLDFLCWKYCQNSMYPFIDIADVIKACAIVNDMTRSTQITISHVCHEQMEHFLSLWNIPTSAGYFLLYYFSFSLLFEGSGHRTRSSSSSIAFLDFS